MVQLEQSCSFTVQWLSNFFHFSHAFMWG